MLGLAEKVPMFRVCNLGKMALDKCDNPASLMLVSAVVGTNLQSHSVCIFGIILVRYFTPLFPIGFASSY